MKNNYVNFGYVNIFYIFIFFKADYIWTFTDDVEADNTPPGWEHQVTG